jgi:hypothetical protein
MCAYNSRKCVNWMDLYEMYDNSTVICGYNICF